MKTPIEFQEYIGVRARIQRLSDAKMCYGWVESFESHEIKIDIEDSVDFRSQDLCFIEISGAHSALSLQASFLGTDRFGTTFVVIGSFSEREPYEDMRVRGTYRGKVVYLGETLPIVVEDWSKNGIGLYCQKEVERWVIVEVFVSTPFGDIEDKAQIRYCRYLGPIKWSYRVGLQLQGKKSLSEITERLLSEATE
jgi:hypothetical protein